MDYLKMTAPCGLDCFNCDFFLAHEDTEAMKRLEKKMGEHGLPVLLCKGCRAHNGRIPLQQHVYGKDHRCGVYECTKEKNIKFCVDCGEFPCDHLHPYAEYADSLPHNIKIYNLCLIKKMGLEKWAESKAAEVRDTYFTKPWTIK